MSYQASAVSLCFDTGKESAFGQVVNRMKEETRKVRFRDRRILEEEWS